jgi:hypothetical protein
MASAPHPAKIVIGGLLLCVPVFLAVLAVPRFLQGTRTEGFQGVVESASSGVRLESSTYRAAADAYAGTTPDDGEGMANFAQVLALTSEYDPAIVSRSRELAVQALRDAPSNPQAWLLLCQIEQRRTPQAAVACLDHAFAIAPYDWYTTGRRMSLVADEWPYLDQPLRDKAVSLVLPMWRTTDPDWLFVLHFYDELYALTATENGRELLRAGFTPDREALRSFNRFIIDQRYNGR